MRRGLAGIAVAIIVVGVYITIRDRARGYHTTYGATIQHLTLHSTLVHRDLHELRVVPMQHANWTLVLLYGRGGSASSWLKQPFFDALHDLGAKAPVVLFLDGKWGPATLRQLRGYSNGRVAIGGISMGGYGALLLGAKAHVCAVGAHSPALALHAGPSAVRNDIVGRPPHYRAPVWIDVGTQDPFHDAAVHYAHEIHAQLHVWPGGHDSAYWNEHMRSYLRFYARHCG